MMRVEGGRHQTHVEQAKGKPGEAGIHSSKLAKIRRPRWRKMETKSASCHSNPSSC